MDAIRKFFGVFVFMLVLVGITATGVKAIPPGNLGQIIDPAEDIGVPPQPTETPFTVEYIKVNGEVYNSGETLVVRRGEDLNIKVKIKALQNVYNLQAEAAIYGYEYGETERSLVSDVTDTFDLNAGEVVYKELHVTVPVDMRKKPTKLRVIVTNDNGDYVYVFSLQLNIKGVDRDNSVVIKDFAVSPTVVQPGKTVKGAVELKNIGDKTIEFVKVVMSIPELNLEAVQYLDPLRRGETDIVNDLEIYIPENTEPGTYDVVLTVFFDKYGKTSAETSLIVSGKTTGVMGETSITLPGQQTVTEGEEVALPVMITNNGEEAKTYTLSVENANWAAVRFEPGSAVVVGAGETKTVYIYVSPLEGVEEGVKTLTLKVSDGKTTQEMALSVKVVSKGKSAWEVARLVLEIILVLLVLALLVVGLVLALKKSKKEEEEEVYY